MEVKSYTCPFTGAPFNAVTTGKELIIRHPLTHDNITMHMNGTNIEVPLSTFVPIMVMTPSEVAETLEVSRQRVSTLAKNGMLTPYYIFGQQVFLKEDVIDYKNHRKTGRPKKE